MACRSRTSVGSATFSTVLSRLTTRIETHSTASASQTARILDVKYHILLPTPEDAGGNAQVTPASGDVEYTQVTLLPNVKYTIPLLVGILGLWLAWRLVNVPAFADFLIATEAEMNKVSWATRKQLAQDTVVVLVTVILMTIFLFFADVIWSTGLKMIGVLQSGQTAGQQAEKEVPW